LSENEIKEKLANKTPHVIRLKVSTKIIEMIYYFQKEKEIKPKRKRN